ncbi:MAG TPA: hypothetical protein VI306_01155 [Pyrinomonadaceae bacterium]
MTRRLRFTSIFFFLLFASIAVNAQSRRSFHGNWNWAEYATDESELPPAYQNMDLKDVPRYAVDLTIKQRGNKISGDFGIVARYLARVDEGSFSGTIKGSTVTFRVKSNFGGSATIQLTLRNNKLTWKNLKSSGQMYFPDEIELRRLMRGEKPPYVANDDEPF